MTSRLSSLSALIILCGLTVFATTDVRAATDDLSSSEDRFDPPLQDIEQLSSPLLMDYVRDIPVPTGVRGKSLSFRKIVFGADIHNDVGKTCDRIQGRKPSTLEYSDAIEPWFMPEAFKAAFVDHLFRAGYNIAPQEDNLFSDTVYPPVDYQVAARIVKVRAWNCISYNEVLPARPYAPEWERVRVWWQEVEASLDVEWQVFDNARGIVVFTTITHGKDEAHTGAGQFLASSMHRAFRRALRDLMGDRRFYALFFGDTISQQEAAPLTIRLAGTAQDSDERLNSKRANMSLATIETDDGKTDGFVLSTDGYILASADAVRNVSVAKVKIGNSRRTIEGAVQRISFLSDVALIKIAPPQKPLVPLPLRTNRATEGEKVFILSNGKSRRRLSGTIIARHDSEPGREVLVSDIRHLNKVHGTPLLDANGNVLGIKIRDFAGEVSSKEASRYLAIHDALSALQIQVSEEPVSTEASNTASEE